MEPRQLRYFVAVAEERSFTRAAARLHLSQQSLSAAIQRFETQLGYPLLERTSQRVSLTAAGEALLGAAPGVVEAVEGALAAAGSAAGAVHGRLHLRYGLDSEAFVEPLLTSFQDMHREIVVHAWLGTDADNLSALRAGDADAVFAWAEVPADLEGEQVAEDRALLALPNLHPLARLEAVPVGLAAREPLVMFPREISPAVWDLLVNALHGDAGKAAPIRHVPVSGQKAMADAVLRGDGLCPVSESLATSLRRPGLVLRRIDPPVTVALHLLWRRGAHVARDVLAGHAARARIPVT